MSSRSTKGVVYLVGAGPGDPGLLTLRGRECLEAADVVLYDYLANASLLDWAPSSAERICLGKHGRGRLWSQDEVHAAIVSEALAGKTVVRLKGGDPAVFARLIEELDALENAGVSYEVVPGITAASAVAAYAGIPLTERDAASAVALVAGQESDLKTSSPLDASSLAHFPGTLVYYMGVVRAARWSEELLAAGKPADTPVALVRRCSWPDQQVWFTTLGEVAGRLDQSRPDRIRPPVLVVVGEVVRKRRERGWFERRPLFGHAVLASRAADQIGPLRDSLRRLGAEVWTQPAITIHPPDDWGPLDRAIQEGDVQPWDWIVFSSSNGATAFLDRLAEHGKDARWLGLTRLAAVGPGTAETLRKRWLHADLVPDVHRAEALAEALAPMAAGKRTLLVRASRGRDVLGERLRAAGADVTETVAYASRDVEIPDEEVREALLSGRIGWTAVTSSAIARSLVRMFGEGLRSTRLVSISPLTTATLQEEGFPPAAEARDYTIDGVVEAILAAVGGSGDSPT